MPSDLQVSNIKDLTGSNTGLSIASDGQVSITQNNPTIQLGANASFPSGHILQIAVENAPSFTATAGDGTYIYKTINLSSSSCGKTQIPLAIIQELIFVEVV